MNCRYYQAEGSVLLGRDRWVEYADGDVNATQVPPEWHSWLHHSTDLSAEEV